LLADVSLVASNGTGVATSASWGCWSAVTSTLVASSGSALLLVGKVNWGGLVDVGQRRLRGESRRGGHDVDLCGVQGQLRAQIQPNSRPRTIANTPYTWLV
jgi:hypothetical protein